MRFWIYNIQQKLVDDLGTLFAKRKFHGFFYSLLYPLIVQYNEYDLWRREHLYLTNVNSQAISLKNYLNDLFDADFRRITIQSALANTDGVFVSLESEAVPFLAAGLESSNEEGVFVATEIESVGNKQFIISLPLALKTHENELVAKVNTLRLAGKKFSLQYF